MIPKRTDEIRVPISTEPTVSSMADIQKGTHSDMYKKMKVRGARPRKERSILHLLYIPLVMD